MIQLGKHHLRPRPQVPPTWTAISDRWATQSTAKSSGKPAGRVTLTPMRSAPARTSIAWALETEIDGQMGPNCKNSPIYLNEFLVSPSKKRPAVRQRCCWRTIRCYTVLWEVKRYPAGLSLGAAARFFGALFLLILPLIPIPRPVHCKSGRIKIMITITIKI